MLELIASRAGPPTTVLQGVYLHSTYDPTTEAERFAQQCLGPERPSGIVLLGAGLGYLVRALRARAPQARVIPVYYDAEVYRHAVALLSPEGRPRSDSNSAPEALAAAWHPDRSTTLLEHLRSEIPELEGEGLIVVEWPASARMFSEGSRAATRAVRQVLRELRGSLVTTAAFGRRWLRNAFRNFVFLENLRPRPLVAEAPVFIAAAGPSLDESLELITPYRSRFSLWALPSAVPALRERGLHPDLVVLTDPGYYGAAHLHAGAGMGFEVAMPLSAASGALRLGCQILPLSHGTFFEVALCELGALAPVTLPSFGTVAATALELARRLGAREVVLAGLDLCYRDIRTHTRPNLSELLLDARSGRLSPFVHHLFARRSEESRGGGEAASSNSRAGKSNLSLDTYAGWFAGLPERFGPTLYRLLPSEVRLPAFRDLDPEGFRTYARTLRESPGGPAATGSSEPPHRQQNPAHRRAQAHGLLSSWSEVLSRAARQLPAEGRQACALEPLPASLCYYIDAAGLAEAHRLARLAGPQQAARRLETLLRQSAEFLAALSATMGEG